MLFAKKINKKKHETYITQFWLYFSVIKRALLKVKALFATDTAARAAYYPAPVSYRKVLAY